MSEVTEVPLGPGKTHDLAAIRDAIRGDTTVVYLCNPNNPTGTIVPSGAVSEFIESVPEQVLVVIDEAYHDYVTATDYSTSVPHAIERENVLVLRTFSKVYSLAAHRVGYGVAAPATVTELRKAQPPFSVTTVGQVAATASLGNPDELKRRIQANAAARHHLLGALSERSLPHTESQTNFIYLELPFDAEDSAQRFIEEGVIVRPMSGGWLRVTIGSDTDNRRFLDTLDRVVADPADDLG
jgi:histidinol-phosphate aminotransferase